MSSIVDKNSKEKFLNAVKNFMSASIYNQFAIALPSELFLFPQHRLLFPSGFQGSPIAMFDRNYVKLLSLDKRINVEGIQHGGGFGEFKAFEIEKYERDFSDTYTHWGLGEKNIIQPRYPIRKSSNRNCKSVRLLGTIEYDSLFQFITKIQVKDYYSALENREILVEKLGAKVNLSYIPHPKNINEIKYNISNVKLHELDEKDLTRSVFILDWPGHTFFYQAIYQSIPIILYFNRQWSRHFTNKYLSLLKILRKQGALFYWDEQDLLIQQLFELVNGGIFSKDTFDFIRNKLEM